MTEIQVKLLSLMEEFDKICQAHDIEYFFAGGTALGAIRNGGFLPWDDDADVLIKRSEFERLDKIMNDMAFEDKAWITDNNNRTYLNPTARLFDLNSTDILESRLDYGAPKGCQVEVFVMDPFPSDREKQIDFIRHLWVYSEVTNNYILYGSLRMPAEMLDPDLFYYYRKRLETESMESVKKEILEKITYPEEECEYWCGRWSCMPYVFRKEWMAKQKYVPFEGRNLPIPDGVLYEMVENYDANWDIIPLPKAQKIHPSIKSATVSYRALEGKIREWCDEVDYNSLLYANKADRVERLFARFRIEKDFSRIRQVYLTEIAEELNKQSWNFSIRELPALNKAFEEFFLTQFKYSYSKYRLSVPLHEDLLETMLLALIHSDRIEHASLLNSLYPDWRKQTHYADFCDALGELKIKKYEENIPVVENLLKKLAQFPVLAGQQEIERAQTWYLTQTSAMDAGEIADYFAACRHQNDLELKKYIGDLYEKAGAPEQAKELYEQVLAKSRNGMILYDLEKRGFTKN